MQTQCPHCHTVFKVSDEHLKMADGFVRCGVCKEVFNAIPDKAKATLQAHQERPSAKDTTASQPEKTTSQKAKDENRDSGAVNKTRFETDSITGRVQNKSSGNESVPVNVNKPIIDTTPSNQPAQNDMFSASPDAAPPKAKPATSTTTNIKSETKAEAAKPETKEGAAIKSTAAATEALATAKTDSKINEQDIKPESAAIAKEPLKATSQSAAKADNLTSSTPAKTETLTRNAPDKPNRKAENDLFSDVQSKLIPDEFRIPELHNTYSIWQDLAWSVAILMLAASLFVEYAWFNRNELVANPQLRPYITQFCFITDCNTMDLREPGQIEMTTRNIYTHPNVRNALMISGTLINHAKFEQPYPNILIDFSDVRGEVIASRTFTPEDYLQIKATSLRPLAPEIPVNFNIEIQDPGKNAMTYEFSFL
ncbi:MAG: zinc-ribbon domain-containing protein [Gammaproteobacteria bacterium]|nr:zinc-ribbon domain-containing protein [Gammaproteobacteria bacterium]